jgi:periplasmic divalent cation tolerance protein
MSGEIIVMITCPADNARAIASLLVEEKLAACVNIVSGVTSIYSWQGKVEESSESLLVVKSQRQLFGELEARVRVVHPYDIPEVIAFDLADGSKPYLNWLNEAVSVRVK